MRALAGKKSKSKLDYIPDDYLQSIREKLKAQKARPGRSRERAIKFLEQQITRLLRSGYAANEIMEMVNEGHTVINSTDIEKMIAKISEKKQAPKDEPSPTSEADEERLLRSDTNDGNGNEHGDGNDEVLRG